MSYLLHSGSTVLRCYRRAAHLFPPLIKQQPQLRGVCRTPMVMFDLKHYEMEKRRRRDLEKAGLDVEDDDEPWISQEEQKRISEEEERQRAEEAERVKEMLARRTLEDIEKRKKFKEFRARQLAMSQNRKEANVASKKQARGSQRVLEELIDDTEDAEHKVADEKPSGTRST